MFNHVRPACNTRWRTTGSTAHWDETTVCIHVPVIQNVQLSTWTRCESIYLECLSAHSLCFSVTFCFVNEMLDGYDNYWAISKQLMRVRLVNIIAGIPVLNFSKQCLRTFYMFRQILVRKFLWELVYFVVFCSM